MADSHQPQQPDSPAAPPPAARAASRVIGGAFGLGFAGIGLAVIGTLWFGDGMGDPPVIFKLVGSFIAMIFVAVGGTALVGAVTGAGLMAPPQQPTSPAATATSPADIAAGPRTYTCPHCGGGLDRNADVSPMGDAKCAFCGRWFNVHGRSSG